MKDPDKKTLLLVEDEAILALNEKIQLEKYGYNVVVAYSGEKAIEIVQTDTGIDLVLMDIDLGKGLDGIETALLILARIELPVVFLSSHTDPSITGKTEKITSYGYVVKDSSITVLDASIKMAFKLFDSNRKVMETKKHLESIIESTEDLIWSVNPEDFGLITFNQSLYDYFFEKRNICLQPGMRPVDLFPSPDPVDVWVSYYNRAMEHGSFKTEYLTYSKDTVLELKINTIESGNKIMALSVFGKDITKQKQYERDLLAAKDKAKENEVLFRSTFEQAAVGIAHVGLNGRFLRINRKFCELLGYSQDEMLSLTFQEITHQDFLGQDLDNVERLLTDEIETYDMEKQYIRKDASAIWVNLTASLVRDSRGDPEYLIGVVQDITDRKVAEASVKEHESRFRSFIEQAPMGIGVFDLAGYGLYANKIFLEIMGLTKNQEIAGKPAYELFVPGYKEQSRQRIKRRQQGLPVPDEFESVVLRPDGIEVPVKLAVAPIRLTDKTVSISFVSDMTEQKKIEQSIRASEVRFRRVMENSSEAIIFLNDAGQIIYQSPSIFEVTGYSDAEKIGKYGFDMIHPDDVSLVKVAYDQLVQLPGKKKQMEMRILHKDGSYRTVEMRATNLLDDPAVKAIVVNFNDITDSRKAMLRLAKLTECFLEFGSDPVENINILAAFIGEQLNGTCALYNRLEDGQLHAVGRWKLPLDYRVLDYAEGHICNTVLSSAKDEITWIPDLQDTSYAITDRNVGLYGLKTYLGIPVWLSGTNRGSLCLVYQNDYQPDDNELRLLKIVASAIGVEESRWQMQSLLRMSEEKFRFLVESMDDIIFSLDREQRHTGVYGSWVQNMGLTKEAFLGKTAREILMDTNTGLHESMNRQALSGTAVSYEWSTGTGDDQIYFHTKLSPLKNASDEITGIVGIGRDITDLKQAELRVKLLLDEKELLLKEVHHRIKNNMNTVMSMLSLQAGLAQDTASTIALEDARRRLVSMSRLYDTLYLSKSYSKLSIKAFLAPLIEEIITNFPGSNKVKIKKDIQDFMLKVEYIQPLGIMINELLTNTMKHAFDGKEDGVIEVTARNMEGNVILIIEDNGKGMGEFREVESPAGFGLQLVQELASQMNGSIRTEQGKGTRVVLEFKV
jgi:PAS domain S-box-containing protein